jgi:hypothetical protein
MRGKFAKLQLNNEQGWLRLTLFFVSEKIFQLFFQKPLDKVATLWYYSGVSRNTKGEKNVSKKVKIHISLATEIYEKGKEEADKLGIPFSTYLSVLIAKDTNSKKRK